MSVCFFVPADQAGGSNVAEEVEAEVIEDMSSQNNCQLTLQQFWAKVTEDIKKVTSEDFKTQALPLARIKKIMKLDEEVKMISGEAPVLFAKAAEIFIHELTLRAWAHTEDNKRRTLQRNDIAMAISKSDQFDFLIDIVPRHEIKVSKPREETHRSNTVAEHMSQQHQTTMQGTAPQQLVVQPCAQVVQASTASGGGGSGGGGGAPAACGGAGAGGVMPQPVALVQQVASGDMQQLPLQLTQAQINMIRLHVQNNPTQPIIIQAQPQQSPQIIQVSSQGQHQPQQQVFLAQVATSQDDS